MTEGAEGRLLKSVVIGVIAAVLLPSLFGGTDDRWGKWIYDYQTLITGLLALGAAYITVAQMQRSDRRAESRHRELADLQLRPFELKVGRLCQPNIAELLNLCEGIRSLAGPPRILAGESPIHVETYRRWVGRVITICAGFELLLDRPSWTHDSDVMDGWMKYLYSELKATHAAVSRAANFQMDLLQVWGCASPVDQSTADAIEADRVNLDLIFELEELANSMVKDLRALAGLYKVDVSEMD